MEWIIFSIFTALIWASVNTIDKYILTRWIRYPIVSVMILGVVGLIAGTFVYLTIGFSDLSYTNIILALIAGLFFMLMVYFYFNAVKIEEISRVVPLLHLTPIFILLLASFFLGEVFEPIRYGGILLIVAGALMISMKKSRLGKAFWLMVLGSLSLAINQVLTKYLLGFADFWTIFSWTRFGAFISLIPIYLAYSKRLKDTVQEKGSKVIAFVSFNELLYLTGMVLITYAASVGPITLVNALSSLQPMFVFIFAVMLSIFFPRILEERVKGRTLLLKLIAIVMMVGGAVLVA